MSTLHIFDMDGTLLSGSACLDISRHLGRLQEVSEIEARWAVGGVGHVEFYELCLPLWRGLTADDVDTVFAAAGWMLGVREVFADIAARGEHSAVITLSPQFFADRLLGWGAEFAFGAAVQAGVPPVPERVLTPGSKVAIAEDLLARLGLGDDDCVAYGDSSSDVPLFHRLGHTVAVNGSDSLRAVAAVAYDGDDLREAYGLARALIAPAGARR